MRKIHAAVKSCVQAKASAAIANHDFRWIGSLKTRRK